ncbi:MAG: hypothetical protein ACRDRB_06380 [Pseudonocardiaceae bacterium]
MASVAVGAALGVGGVTLASATSSVHQPTPHPRASAHVASSHTPSPRPSEVAALVDPVAFAAPATDAVGMSVTVLRPEKVQGGMRFTIALANTSGIPITVDTGALGPQDPRFNDTTVPMTMTSVRKKLVPGEGYTYQCVFKLPTMDVGQLAFVVGPVSVSGPAAGD